MFFIFFVLVFGFVEVVMVCVGGICFDMFFIDEGFGFFDGDMFDVVMCIFDELC